MKQQKRSKAPWGLLLLAGACAVYLSGCSTPASRIKENQELFDTYSFQTQDNIEKGNIDIGYTKEMVYMALGKPDRQYRRTTISGITAIWSYTAFYTTKKRQRAEGSFRVKDSTGRYRTVSDSIWVDVDQKHEYEVKRIELEDGIVTAIEDVEIQRGLVNSDL